MSDLFGDEALHPSSLPPDDLLTFSWIVPDRLAVGPAPRTYAALQRLGFDAAINLQEQSEQGPIHEDVPQGFKVVHLPIRDGVVGGVPSQVQISEAAETIRILLEMRRKVYVHCYAGVGRSPTACIAYLANFESMGLEEATRRVVQCHQTSSPTEAQLAAVERYLDTTTSA